MHGQGALEYLIIIAAVLGITAVVVTFVTSAFTTVSSGGDLNQCRLAAANCKKDLALGVTTHCDYCIDACTDANNLDILNGVEGGGLACELCLAGDTNIQGGGEQTIDLVAYWPFNVGTGTTIADQGSEGNNGIFYGENFHNGILYNGPAWVTGKYGGAVHFDGLNDHIGILDAQNLKYRGGNFTISAWIYADERETDQGWVISKPWNGNGIYNYGFKFHSDGRIMFWLGGSTRYEIYSTITVSRGAWHHIAATVNTSGHMRIYIDGIERGAGVHNIVDWTPGYPGDSNVQIAIGTYYPYGEGWSGRGDFSFNGTIDAVRILNKTLNITEVQAEMASSRPAIRPMVSLEMEEGSGINARDTHIWVAGKSGTAISFDGVNDYVEIPSSPSLSITDKITLSYWFRLENNFVSSSATTMIRKNISDWLSEPGTDNIVSWYVVNSTGAARNAPFGAVQNGKWYHAVGVYNGSDLKSYLNTVLVSSVPHYGPIRTSNSYLRLGNWGAETYWGYLDEVRIYGRELSQAEISALYNV